MSNGLSGKSVFNNKGCFTVRQLDVGEADVRNELRVGLYDDADRCIGNVTFRVDPKGEPQFVMTTGGDGFWEKSAPLIVVAPVRPYAEAAMLWDPSAPGDGLCKLRAVGTPAPAAASDIEATRAQFEHQIYAAHFISTIGRTGMGGPIEFMPDPEKSLTKAELCARDEDGHYTRNEVSAMWFGWCAAAEAMSVVKPQTSLGGSAPENEMTTETLALAGIDPKTKRCTVVGLNNDDTWRDIQRDNCIAVPITKDTAKKIWGEPVEDIYAITASNRFPLISPDSGIDNGVKAPRPKG